MALASEILNFSLSRAMNYLNVTRFRLASILSRNVRTGIERLSLTQPLNIEQYCWNWETEL